MRKPIGSWIFLAAGVLFPFWASGSAQDRQVDFVNAHKSLRMTALEISQPIELDGVLSEAAWQRAEPATHFIQKLPQTGAPATEPTEVRILYDESNLYIGVHCYDSAGEDGIVINDITRDFYTLDSDGFQVILDTFNDDRNAFLFGTNPGAGKFDMQIANDGDAGNTSWDGIWHVETSIDQEGWHIEIALPFKTLRFGQDEEMVWGINFERRVRRKFEDSYWAPLPPPYRLGRISLGGTLLGLEDVSQGRNLYLKPYLSVPVTRREADDVDVLPDAGFDVKYSVTSQLTLDGTVNTDFSQVEADQEQINLTRFSLFFPEKRDFFLENAGIFEWGRRPRGGGGGRRPDLIPFFSRRIGLTEEGEVVPILGGARLTGRAGAYTLGLLSMQTDAFRSESSGDISSTNFSVFRVRRDILRKSDIGGLFINKAGAEGETNRTYGTDANFTFFNNLDLTTYLLKTETPGVEHDDTASNVGMTWREEWIEARASHLRIGENLNPEVGFVPRTGIHKSAAETEFFYRPEAKIPWIREFNPSVEVSYITNTENVLETRETEGRFTVIFSDSSMVSAAHMESFERLEEPFEIRDDQVIPAGDYSFAEDSIFFRSDQSRKISVETRYSNGEFFDGDRDSYRLGMTVQPTYRFSADIEWGHNDVVLPSGAFDTDLVASRLNYSFSNRMFLNALIQYNSDDDEIISNIRFNFIHKPLSNFFLVYNERRETGGEVIDRALIGKITYVLAF